MLEPADPSNHDVMVARAVIVLTLAFQYCQIRHQNSGAFVAGSELDPEPLVRSLACKLGGELGLVFAQDIQIEDISRDQCLESRQMPAQADGDQGWFKRNGGEGIHRDADMFPGPCQRRHHRDPGGIAS